MAGRSPRAVVIASGARYRRPSIPALIDFEGRGSPTGPLPSRLGAAGEGTVLVGGGTRGTGSGLPLRSRCPRPVLIRGSTLSQSMSRYRGPDRRHLNIHVHPFTELAALRGNERGAETVRWKNNQTGLETEANIRHVFPSCADPATEGSGLRRRARWKGFVKTGADLTLQDLVQAGREMSPERWRRAFRVSSPSATCVAARETRRGPSAKGRRWWANSTLPGRAGRTRSG
jgi:thioredoxin reductase